MEEGGGIDLFMVPVRVLIKSKMTTTRVDTLYWDTDL